MKTQNQWLFEASFASEALFEFEALTREQMASFITKTWAANPILKRIGEIRDLRGADLSKKLNLILQQFQAVTGIKVDIVSDGAVQKVRGKGNFASLRSLPGSLQIEESVFRDPQKLLKEVQHELAFHFAGGRKGVPSLGNGPMNAMNFLEMMIQENGKLPSLLAEALRSPGSSEYEAEWLFEAPFTQQPLSAELESPDFMAHTKGARGSTEGRHQKGQRTDIMNQGGEKADPRRPHGKPKIPQNQQQIMNQIADVQNKIKGLYAKRGKVEPKALKGNAAAAADLKEIDDNISTAKSDLDKLKNDLTTVQKS